MSQADISIQDLALSVLNLDGEKIRGIQGNIGIEFLGGDQHEYTSSDDGFNLVVETMHANMTAAMLTIQLSEHSSSNGKLQQLYNKYKADPGVGNMFVGDTANASGGGKVASENCVVAKIPNVDRQAKTQAREWKVLMLNPTSNSAPTG